MAGQTELVEVTDKVHLAHGPAVNWTLVTDDAGVMLIDAGYPGDRAEVLASLAKLGYGPADVRAILLTHAHIDHLGTAIWFAAVHGTPVYSHPDEVGHAKRDYQERVSIPALALRLWRPRWALWTLHVVRSGGLNRNGIPTAKPLTDQVAAELPGRPQPVFSPGHTNGHCSYLVDGVLVSGDALITGHPLIRHDGPQLLPAIFSYSQQECIRTLSTLARVEAEILAAGHGPLWRGPITEATDAALKKAAAR